MSVRFIVGRAGTGKTQLCVEEIACALAAAPLGPALWWLVPDQATFMAERLLARRVGGSVRAQVLSFRRLTHQLALESGVLASRGAEHLDELARLVLLTGIVQARRHELTLFQRVADRPGFITRLDAMLRELMQAGQTPASLRALVAEFAAPRGTGRPAPLLADKLRDLAVLMEAFEAALAERGLAGERLAEEVTARLDVCASLRGARVWVDAFSALNLVEMYLLVGLARHADDVAITLLADPAAPALRDANAPLDEVRLFRRTERLYRMLRQRLVKAGVAVAPLTALEAPRRFETPVLARIERGLFEPAPPEPARDDEPAHGLELWECDDPQAEVRAVAQRICRLIAGGTLRYRDIGLVLPAVEPYVDRVRRIFTEHGIPHFVDERRGIAHHPVVELVRSAVAWSAAACGRDELLLVLKTGLTSVPDDDVHALENYLLAHGIVRTDLQEPFAFIAPNVPEDEPAEPATEAESAAFLALNRTRAALAAAFLPWLELTREATPGGTLARGLHELLERLGVPARVDALLAEARRRQDAELEMLHTQAWGQVVALLETFGRLATAPLGITAFAEMLQSALGGLTLGLIPPTLDQVLVTSVARSRHPELRVVFVVGAVQQQMPAVRPEDPLLTDPQRAAFNAQTGDAIALGSDQQLLEARFFDYVALTRASGRLIVTYPLADAAGRSVAASAYVARLRALAPEAPLRYVAAGASADLGAIATVDDAAAAVLSWAREQISGGGAGPAGSAALYNHLVSGGLGAARRARLWRALDDDRTPALAPERAAALHADPLRLSVSQLERFAECPLRYYLMYSLGLAERQVLELDVLNLGTLQHGILEWVMDRIIAAAVPWPDCSVDELRALVAAGVQAVCGEIHQELAERTAHYEKMQQRAVETLTMVLEAQRRAAAVGALRPAGTEIVFGALHSTLGAPAKLRLPALALVTPGGRRVELRGKIDRLDVCAATGAAAVVDYKSAAQKRLGLASLLHGLTLQLPVYLLVAEAHGRRLRPEGVRPIAGFYVGLGLGRRTRRQRADLPEPGTDGFYQQVQVHGVLNAEAIGALDTTAQAASAWYGYRRNKDGTLSRRGNEALEAADFALLLAFTRRRVATLADALCAGSIAAAPVREGQRVPCTHCEFRALCPFDATRDRFREVPRQNADDVLAAMRQEVEHG